MRQVIICAIFVVVGIFFVFTTERISAEDGPGTFVKQRRPVFSSFQPLFDSNEIVGDGTNEITQSEPKSLRKGIGKTLADWGVIIPKKNITLSIDLEKLLENLPDKPQNTEVEEITWAFYKDYYFPETPFANGTITVTAWRSFPVTAKVKFMGEKDLKIYTTWINVD